MCVISPSPWPMKVLSPKSATLAVTPCPETETTDAVVPTDPGPPPPALPDVPPANAEETAPRSELLRGGIMPVGAGVAAELEPPRPLLPLMRCAPAVVGCACCSPTVGRPPCGGWGGWWGGWGALPLLRLGAGTAGWTGGEEAKVVNGGLGPEVPGAAAGRERVRRSSDVLSSTWVRESHATWRGGMTSIVIRDVQDAQMKIR